MLDLTKKYYVSAGTRPKCTIESWANWNEMKLIGEDLALSDCSRVYELDVQYNDDLKIALTLLGSGRPRLVNGKRTIGRVVFSRDSPGRVVIYPEIADR